jgi:hypothetical protein
VKYNPHPALSEGEGSNTSSVNSTAVARCWGCVQNLILSFLVGPEGAPGRTGRAETSLRGKRLLDGLKLKTGRLSLKPCGKG